MRERTDGSGGGWRYRVLLASWLAAALSASAASPTNSLPISIAIGSRDAPTSADAAVALRPSTPGQVTFYLRAPTSTWVNITSLDFDVDWPAMGATNAQVLVHMMDWDYFWYQNLLPGYLAPGERNHFRVALAPGAAGWAPSGHYGAWSLEALAQPVEFGVRVFYPEESSGTCRLSHVTAALGTDTSPPYIRGVVANAAQVRCYEKFELTFELPDRYPDPFDSEKVSVVARFETPDGKSVPIEGYHGRNCYRTIDSTGEHVVPQGPPYWRVRYAPRVPGKYRYTLEVRDTRGRATWGPGAFDAMPAERPGFVRVSKRDPRCFEFDNGSYYFPIGHNIRSPFDTRMDSQFPWAQRWPEGSAVYTRYFKSMAEHGETLTEIWSAAWSLGLEWSPLYRGYHGIGQFNLFNAWEMDRVLEEAENRGIHINFVVHNHGKYSTLNDHEWEVNPYNVENGGYLERPDEYFSDPRAMKSFRKLMRYIVSRWGYSPQIFAWELWSELDLTGSYHGSYRRPQVTDWHRLMGRAVKDLDPYDHLVSTHVCGDYTHQSEPIIELPEIDFCAVDAYHGSMDPLHIVTLMRDTASYNNAFNKPVLITEFGGSAYAAGVKHLRDSLHAALWASVCLPLGGTPMFWWWQLVDEEDLYPEFQAVSKFMKGEDRRDPAMVAITPTLRVNDAAAWQLGAQCLMGPKRGLGWIYQAQEFSRLDPLGPPGITNLVLQINGVANARFRVQFWDTSEGKAVGDVRTAVRDGTLKVDVPPFARDIAFKVKAD